MLTRPPTDPHCLTLALQRVQEWLKDPEKRALASKYNNPGEIIADICARPQLYDALWVLPNAPRLPCHPPMRVRFDPEDPQCGERAMAYLFYAEILDPDTPRTLMTIRINGQNHVIVIEYRENGVEPVILDPLGWTRDATITANLSYAAVAQLFGYGPNEVSPVADPHAWAQTVAERDGLDTRNGSELLAVAERYADLYPGGRQGVAQLAEQFGGAVKDAAVATAKAGKKAGKAAGKAAKKGAKVGKQIAEEAAEEYKQRPEIGQLLRTAVVGYGGPVAVLAIDVVENRLNKQGYTLGSLAESHDTDVFAFK